MSTPTGPQDPPIPAVPQPPAPAPAPVVPSLMPVVVLLAFVVLLLAAGVVAYVVYAHPDAREPMGAALAVVGILAPLMYAALLLRR
ncbi:hypothetical protein [Streptomyces sp. NPDC058595]|uniref:hypothetical protein n=1 Tax=Streptomyces sp. NPDC058595 TaxID=3346550 RepID=UPI0036673FFB